MAETKIQQEISFIVKEIRQNPEHIIRTRNFNHEFPVLYPEEYEKTLKQGIYPERQYFNDEEDITVFIDFPYFPDYPISPFFQKIKSMTIEQRRQYGRSRPGHSHEFFEMFYVYSGKVYCNYNSKEYELNPGCFWLFNTKAAHNLVLGGDDTNVFNILVRKSTFTSTMLKMIEDNNLFLKFFLESIYSVSDKPKHMEFYIESESRLEQFIFEIIKEYHYKHCFGQNIMKSLLSCVLAELARQYRNFLQNTPLNQKQKLDIIQIISYISDHCSNTSLHELSEQFHYTSDYISKFIFKSTGKHYSDLITSFKMEKASHFLVSTDFSLDEIPAMIGYSERANFEKMFKRYYQITPAAFRKQRKNN